MLLHVGTPDELKEAGRVLTPTCNSAKQQQNSNN